MFNLIKNSNIQDIKTNSFDISQQSANYESFNKHKKDADYTLPNNLFEPIIEKPLLKEDEQEDLTSSKYNQEITVQKDKIDDLTTKPQLLDMMNLTGKYNDYNPNLTGNSPLVREQRKNQQPIEQASRNIVEPGTNSDIKGFIEQATQQQLSAYKEAQQAYDNRNQFTPEPIKPSVLSDNDPNYGIRKQHMETNQKAIYDLNNYYQASNVGENSFMKRLPPMPLINQTAPVITKQGYIPQTSLLTKNYKRVQCRNLLNNIEVCDNKMLIPQCGQQYYNRQTQALAKSLIHRQTDNFHIHPNQQNPSRQFNRGYRPQRMQTSSEPTNYIPQQQFSQAVVYTVPNVQTPVNVPQLSKDTSGNMNEFFMRNQQSFLKQSYPMEINVGMMI